MRTTTLRLMVVVCMSAGCSGEAGPTPPSRPDPPRATIPAPENPPQPLPLGDIVNTSCDCFCATCAVGETTACREFASNLPRSGALNVVMDFEAGQSMFMAITSLGRPVYATGESPLVIRQSISPGNVNLRFGCSESVQGKQVDVRLRATLEDATSILK